MKPCGFTAEAGVQKPWDRHPPSPHVLLCDAHSECRAVQSLWTQLWRRGGHTLSSIPHSAITRIHRRAQWGGWTICFRQEGPSSSRCFVALKDLILTFWVPKLLVPIELWATSLSPKMDSCLSSCLLFWKSGDNHTFMYFSSKEGKGSNGHL